LFVHLALACGDNNDNVDLHQICLDAKQ